MTDLLPDLIPLTLGASRPESAGTGGKNPIEFVVVAIVFSFWRLMYGIYQQRLKSLISPNAIGPSSHQGRTQTPEDLPPELTNVESTHGPAHSWILDRSWFRLVTYAGLAVFCGICQALVGSLVLDSTTPISWVEVLLYGAFMAGVMSWIAERTASVPAYAVALVVVLVLELMSPILLFNQSPWLFLAEFIGLVGLFGYVCIRLIAWVSKEPRWGSQTRFFNFVLLFAMHCSATFAIELSHASGRPLLSAYVSLMVLPYLGYRLALRGVFAVWPRPPGYRLLLLRVFAGIGANDKFFGRLLSDWALIGPLRMIAAADVAASSLSPSIFHRFLSGKLLREFTWTWQGLTNLLSHTNKVLHDGSFRRCAVFCEEERWREAVEQLTQNADVVLMDLRGYTSHHHGCTWEVHHLMQSFRLSNVVFLVDWSTNRHDVSSVLQAARDAMNPGSPNWRAPYSIQVVNIDRPELAEEVSTRLAAITLCVAEREVCAPT